jgi:hypothetical protein
MTIPTTKSDRCTAIRKDGKPCTLPRIEGSRYCHVHSPSRAEERRMFSSKGGKARHHRHLKGEIVPVSFRNMDDVYSLLERTIGDLWVMERSISRDKALISAVLAGIKVLEIGAHEERIKRLEELINGRKHTKQIERTGETSEQT